MKNEKEQESVLTNVRIMIRFTNMKKTTGVTDEG